VKVCPHTVTNADSQTVNDRFYQFNLFDSFNYLVFHQINVGVMKMHGGSLIVMGHSIPFTDSSLYESLTKVNQVFESLESVTQSVRHGMYKQVPNHSSSQIVVKKTKNQEVKKKYLFFFLFL